jgi:hypothetical protein
MIKDSQCSHTLFQAAHADTIQSLKKSVPAGQKYGVCAALCITMRIIHGGALEFIRILVFK